MYGVAPAVVPMTGSHAPAPPRTPCRSPRNARPARTGRRRRRAPQPIRRHAPINVDVVGEPCCGDRASRSGVAADAPRSPAMSDATPVGEPRQRRDQHVEPLRARPRRPRAGSSARRCPFATAPRSVPGSTTVRRSARDVEALGQERRRRGAGRDDTPCRGERRRARSPAAPRLASVRPVSSASG